MINTKKIKHVSLGLLLLSTGMPTAFAQYMQAQGIFSSKNITATVILLDQDEGIVAVSTTVVSPPCSGSIAGIGKVKDKKITFSPYEKAENSESCKITIEYDKNWKEISVRGSGCEAYSGNSCGWEGQKATKKNIQ